MRLNKEFKNNCKNINRISDSKVIVITNKGYEIEIINTYAGFYSLVNIKEYGEIYSVDKLKDMLNMFKRLNWM